jgi:NadR type nicotinamide-nucleotide adenylyltransferase
MTRTTVRRVVITGSECTGKTTLARELAGALGTAWSAEYARQYATSVQRPLTEADVLPIMRGQLSLENEALTHARGGTVVHDTDLLSTLVYARHYYGDSPDELEALVRTRMPAATLLLAPDLPWVADGVRDQPQQRAEIHALFVDTLHEFGRSFVTIAGDDRLAAALATVGERDQ